MKYILNRIAFTELVRLDVIHQQVPLQVPCVNFTQITTKSFYNRYTYIIIP